MTEENPTGPTEQLPETDDRADPGGAGRRRLTRVRSEGMLAGVAEGLGRHFDVDPVIFRIAFGVSIFFGGFGLIAYVALALFLPDESGEALVRNTRWGVVAAILLIGFFIVPAGIFWDGPGWGGWGALWLLIPLSVAIGAYAIVKDRGEPASATRVIAAVFVAGAAVAAVVALGGAAALLTAFGWGVVIAALVIAAGVALILGALFGGLRWLIIPALAIATGVGVAAAADLEFDGGIGERRHAPLSADTIPAGGYEVAIGKLAVDLRALDWEADEVVRLDLDVGMGQGIVAVPEDVCVVADAHASMGSLRIVGERHEGINAGSSPVSSTATPRLELEADVQLGELLVVNDDDYDIDRNHSRDFAGAAEQQRSQALACES